MYIYRYNIIKHIQCHYPNEFEILMKTVLSQEEYETELYDKKLDTKVVYKIYKYAKERKMCSVFFYANYFLQETFVSIVSSDEREALEGRNKDESSLV